VGAPAAVTRTIKPGRKNMSQHTTATSGRNILVVGAGPAAWRFVRAYHEGAQDAGRASDTITVLNDEPYIP